MKNLRIVFIGTPDFAAYILKYLIERGFNVVGVITVWDKPAGRGRKLNESAVKKYAKSQNLPILQPKNLKSQSFINDLKSLQADLQVVVAFRMLPKIVWSMPKYGTFNLHTSLLPEYRGSAPINWVIMNGETKTGVTTFFINNKIDAGEIISQRETHIKDDETYGELHDKLMYIGAELVVETIELIAKENVKTIKQPKKSTKLAPKLFIQDCDIDWEYSIDNIYNFIRGLNPYPAARTTIVNGKQEYEIKIYKVSKEYTKHNFETRDIIITKKEMKIAVKEGFIKIEEIKFPGKKQMNIVSFLNGFKFEDNAKVRNPLKVLGS